MTVVHRAAHRVGKILGDLPVLLARQRRHHFAHGRNPPLGVGESAVFFEEGRARQEHVGVFCRLIEEDILHHQAIQCRQCRLDMLGIGVGLGDILALAVQAPEISVQG